MKYLKSDLKHYLVNLGTTLTVIIVYLKFGFQGWPHLLTVLCIHYAVLPLDDWIDKGRPFPYYVLPLLIIAAYFHPIITGFALAGDVIVNLRAVIRRDSFLLEKLESLGNVPIYVIPLMPAAILRRPDLYITTGLFILFADSFHKIGHKETKYPRLTWITGFIFLFLVAALYATPTLTFAVLFMTGLFSLIPFKLLTKKVYIWAYSQAWFAYAGFVGFYYYLYYVV